MTEVFKTGGAAESAEPSSPRTLLPATAGAKLGTGGHPAAVGLPQAGEEEARAGSEAAARKERMKERTPRVDGAGLLKRTFDFDVFACVRRGGRLKGVGV